MTAEAAATAPLDEASASFGSNAIRLTLREWIVSGTIIWFAAISVPRVWRNVERFAAPADFRVPYALSEDYWTYQQLVQDTVDKGQVLVIGDSVIWGEYVTPDATFSHFLNRHLGRHNFVNGGLNGSHSLALSGLVRHHAHRLRDTQVILHCNLLWMSSVERDLQTDREFTFNHPALVPQFWPRIPCYKAPVDERIGVCIDRNIGIRSWVHHLRIRDFESLDVPSWSFEYPYTNPLSQVHFSQIQPLNQPHSSPTSWTERGIEAQDIPWIDLDTSLQWQGFCDTVELLQTRRNSVFVVVGPFNEHLLTETSSQRYRTMKQAAEAWLRKKRIPYSLPRLLPSEEYGDASHPLAAGYARLAQQIYADAAFQRWLEVE